MDVGRLLNLIDEAETRLAGLRGWLLVGSQNGRLSVGTESPSRSMRMLHADAFERGFHELADVAQDLADQLDAVQLGDDRSDHAEIRRLLDAVVKAEARLASIRFAAEDSPIDVATFVERSFDFLRADADTQKAIARDGFEIDSEMLEIFLTEAEELVANIDDNLARLRNDPSNSNALWEIRRSTHTFKGAAGIVGLRKPSELAHRIEDLIDRLADDRVSSKERVTTLLGDAIQCLQALTAGESSGGLVERIERLYEDFDELLATVSPQPEHFSAEPRATLDPTRPAAEHSALSVQRGRQIVRISQNRLDELFGTVCDLVVSRSIFEQRLSDFEMQIDDLNQKTRRLQSAASGNDSDALREMLSMNASLYNVRDSLAMLFEHQRQLVEQIHQKLVGIRMVELASIAGRLQRTVRSTCIEENKLAEISVENEKLEIDTQIVDHLIEPLMHLLKNAVVHGIELPETRRLLGKAETGQIRLRAVNDETHIIFTVSDDGAGIAAALLKEKAITSGHLTRAEADALTDNELLDLIFLPGVTTAEKLTLSAGRGVGMNIVRESITARQGTLTVESRPQSGSTFTIKMPLPMAVSKVLIVTAGGERFAVSMRMIKNVSERSTLRLESIDGVSHTAFANESYRLMDMSRMLNHGNRSSDTPSAPIVLFVEAGTARAAIGVESVLWSDEILFKPIARTNGNADLLGEGILADNQIVSIPDLEYLITKASETRIGPSRPSAASDIMVLIVDDSPSVRYTVSKLLENAGYIVETATDGIDAIKKMGLTKQKPALIITDLEMPRMNGFEFLDILAGDEEFRDIPVVLLTSRSGEEARERAINAGAAEYILKPFEDSRLIEVVEGLVAVSV